MNQEQIINFQIIEQEAQQLNQQIQIIEQNISEIISVKESINEIQKEDVKEILANLGKKVFIPVEIKEKYFIVDVGNKKFVKKSFSEINNLISEQLEKLRITRNQISKRLEDLEKEAEKILNEIEKSKEKD
ncbi:MAG: prefoldin subunit alpha [Candidatus Pacearchaeota archaeon]